MLQALHPIAILFFVSFSLHFVWENMHKHLYTGYSPDVMGPFPVIFGATLGDALLYTIIPVLLVALFVGDAAWFRTVSARHYVALAITGLFIALFVEYKAMALGRWAYTDAMPLIRGIGLSPLIQMTVLLPLSVFITNRIERWLNRAT